MFSPWGGLQIDPATKCRQVHQLLHQAHHPHDLPKVEPAAAHVQHVPTSALEEKDPYTPTL